MRRIAIENAVPGMELAESIYNSKRAVLLKKNVELTASFIEKLKVNNIATIFIKDERFADIEYKKVIDRETKNKTISIVKDVLNNFPEYSHKSSKKILCIRKDIDEALDDIIDQLLHNDNLVVNLIDLKNMDTYTFEHSVNVAILSLITAISMGNLGKDLKELGIGALLHDIGKTRIPLEIINKKTPLDTKELQVIRNHSEYGYNIMKSMEATFSELPSLVILQHHEREDGSGYPFGLPGDKINKYAKIVSVSDVFDALTSDRPYRKRLKPHEAREIMATGKTGFNPDVLYIFFQHIAAYPVGTFVGLSNGLIGMVKKNMVGFPTRPEVRILCTKNWNVLPYYDIDLKEKLNIVVDEVYENIPNHVFSEKKQFIIGRASKFTK